MESNSLYLNREPLLALMKDFYILTGIRIVVFDASFQEILAWPESPCAFCRIMKSNPITSQKCLKSDQSSFLRCKCSQKLEIYHCHAGLVEATAPLIDNGTIIGYIMFGQISDLEEQQDNPSLHEITHKTSEQIQAAAKILEACAFYVVLKDMILLRRKNFSDNLNQFLSAHISEDLSVERLMQEFHISRNKLYESTKEYLGTSIAEYIKDFRMKEAKRLLKETSLPVHTISEQVGFNDYNYFCRVFKKKAGISARKYRQSHKQLS